MSDNKALSRCALFPGSSAPPQIPRFPDFPDFPAFPGDLVLPLYATVTNFKRVSEPQGEDSQGDQQLVPVGRHKKKGHSSQSLEGRQVAVGYVTKRPFSIFVSSQRTGKCYRS